jgi:arylsulfatase A-like enzyme
MDLFPTLLELAAIEAPQDRAGHSLVPLIEGRARPPRPLLVGRLEYDRDAEAEARGSLLPVPRPGWFLRTKAWRYLWFPQSGAEELYRIDRDPFEARNLAHAHPEVAARLRRQLERNLPTSARSPASDESPADAPAPTSSARRSPAG